MSSKRRLPKVFAVMAGTGAAVSACSSASPDDYNCVLKHAGDGGAIYQFRDGGAVADTTVCHAPACNGSFSEGLMQLVYVAPNGDEAPNCMA